MVKDDFSVMEKSNSVTLVLGLSPPDAVCRPLLENCRDYCPGSKGRGNVWVL